MSRKHKADEVICPIYGKAIEEDYCLNECLLNDCGMLLKNNGKNGEEYKLKPDDRTI
ncbi:MAG: hypothetical protein ACI4SE_05755 [Lachnospiraceae bacterium]